MKDLFQDPRRRNSLIGSIVFHVLLLLIFLFTGFTEPDPPLEPPFISVSLALGNSDVGQGEVQPDVPTEPQPDPEPEQQPVETTPTTETPPEVATETESETQVESNPNPDPAETSEPDNPDPKPTSEFENVFSKPKATTGGSQGDDNKPGDFGRPDGTPAGEAAEGYPGPGGKGWGLGGRSPLQIIKPKSECQETGTIVINIRVNPDGKTTSVQLDGKNSINPAECLVKKAKEAALKTRWTKKAGAPAVQKGYIVYEFELN